MIQNLRDFLGLFVKLDDHMDYLCSHYGLWVYAILFLIIFCETGLVVAPFLPGDSLLFTVGAFVARSSLDLFASVGLLFVAAVLGDFLNYQIGARIGGGLFKENALILKKSYLDRTHLFFEKHGKKAIILARFLPMFRTVAPFAAGMSKMDPAKFFLYNVTGGALWVTLMVGIGYSFGNHPVVKKNFEMVVIGIVLISMLPLAWEAISAFYSSKSKNPRPPA